MRWKVLMVGIVAALATAACTPAPSGFGGSGAANLVGVCSPETQWAYGDSITAGFGSVDGWPDQHPPVPLGTFANRAVGGWTISKMGAQLAADLATCEAGALPDRVYILGGANDIGFYNRPLSYLQQDMAAVVATAAGAGVPIRIMSVLPMPAWADWAALNGTRVAFNDWMAATYPAEHLDCASPLADATGFLDPAYSVGDRSHLSDLGAEVVAGCVLASG